MRNKVSGPTSYLLDIDIENPKEYFLLRLITRKDVENLKEICDESFPIKYPDSWYQEIVGGKLISFGISHRNQLIAILVAEIKYINSCNSEDRDLLIDDSLPVLYILNVAVSKNYRRRGFGTHLLNHLFMKYVNNSPYPRAVFLHVLSTNTSAINFYQRSGFKPHSKLMYRNLTFFILSMNYYRINDAYMDGLTYVLYTNESPPHHYEFCNSFTEVLLFPFKYISKLKLIFRFLF